MMNEQQITIGEEILRRLIERDREMHSSDLFDVFAEMEYQKRSMVARLLADHGLVEIQEPVYEGYNIRVTAQGMRAYKMGLKMYLIDQENEKALNFNQKRFSINYGKLALILAAIALSFDIIKEVNSTATMLHNESKEINKYRNNTDNNGGDSQTGRNLILTPEIINAVRDSLLHDTVFLNSIRKQTK